MIERDTFYFRVFCITFWVLAVGNFVIDELLPTFIQLRLLIIMMADVTLILLGLATLKEKWDKIFIIAFVAIGALSSIINRLPFILWINGYRDFIPFLFCLPIFRYFYTSLDSARFRQSFDKQLKIFLVIQAFCVTEQFILYGANDAGGGSLGYGYSGIISMLIILISFYFVSKNWDPENYLRSLWNNRLYIFLMFPVLLNETKVSFLLLVIYILLLFSISIKSLGKILLALPIIAVTIIGGYMVYMWATNSYNDIAEDNYIDIYLTGGSKEDVDELLELAEIAIDETDYGTDDNWTYMDIPRFVKIGLLFYALEDTPGGNIFGAGLGQLKGGSTLEVTDFVKNNPIIFNGTKVTFFQFYATLGILGLIWVFFWFKRLIAFKTQKYKMSLNLKLFLILVCILTFFYNDFFRYLAPVAIFYYLCFASSYPVDENASKE